MKAGDVLKLTLPQLVDDDNDNIKFLSVNLGQASTFISGSFPSFTIKPPISSSGTFPISIFV